MKKRVNSCRKGKVGERQFAAFLRSIGFDARRGEQHAGGPEAPDVVCKDLPRIHFEVKYGYPRTVIDDGTIALSKAFEQAKSEAPVGSIPLVAWKPKGARLWRFTGNFEFEGVAVLATYCSSCPENLLRLVNRLKSSALRDEAKRQLIGKATGDIGGEW